MRNVRREGDAIVGELSIESVARELTFGYGEPSNVSGWIRVWIKDGALQRYQVHREGTVRDRNGSRRFDATTEVLFSNIGSTEVVVPPDVRRLFDA